MGVVIRGVGTGAMDPGPDADFLRLAAQRLGDQTGVDPDRIWAWGFVEPVATGLYCRMLGFEDEGLRYLSSAEAVARAQ